MKRIVLFLATNLAVILVLSIVLRVLGLDRAQPDDEGRDHEAQPDRQDGERDDHVRPSPPLLAGPGARRRP